MRKSFAWAFIVCLVIAACSAAVSAPYWTHVSVARSPSQFGVGYSTNSSYQADNIALVECANRTPSYQTCYVTERSYRVIDW